jgi:transcription elongation factor Elf1
MIQQLDHKLECVDCGTIYLDIRKDVKGDAPIHCSICGRFLGTWAELKADFDAQGGQQGVFEMHEGHIIRKA